MMATRDLASATNAGYRLAKAPKASWGKVDTAVPERPGGGGGWVPTFMYKKWPEKVSMLVPVGTLLSGPHVGDRGQETWVSWLQYGQQ